MNAEVKVLHEGPVFTQSCNVRFILIRGTQLDLHSHKLMQRSSCNKYTVCVSRVQVSQCILRDCWNPEHGHCQEKGVAGASENTSMRLKPN